MIFFPEKDMNLLELELIHTVNFPLFWESLVHVSNFDQGVKCYNKRMIILTDFLFKHVALVFVSLNIFDYFLFLMLQPSWSIFLGVSK